jgi:hypothetical protein
MHFLQTSINAPYISENDRSDEIFVVTDIFYTEFLRIGRFLDEAFVAPNVCMRHALAG